MALGTTATILLGLGSAGAGMGFSKMMARGASQAAPSPLPQPPAIGDSVAKADDVVRKKKSAMSQSIYSSPLGLAGEANIARKVLTGQ